MRLATPPDLNGLVALAEKNGVDIRPTLLRVLTDLYVQKTTHTREEEQRFAELALWLLASADLPTRVAVASKLGGHPATPHPVLRRLARDVAEVAAPVLRHTPRFTEAELREIVQDCGEAHAAILAARRPAVQNDSGVAGAERALAPPRARGAHGGARVSAAGIGRLEGAALRRKPDEFASVLQELLEIPEQAARRVVEDETGESLIAAAKALEMPTDVVVRILILLNPAIGRSVQRVFELVASFRDLAPEAARRIVDGWRISPLLDRRHAHYQPVTWADAADPRPRRSEARRDAARREQPSVPSRVQRTT